MKPKLLALIAAFLLTGCNDDNLPEPRQVCTVITGTYSCGKGGTCQRCGQWEIGCPRPLELRQVPTGAYDKGDPRLVCRMKETKDVSSSTPLVETPLR
ncbi:hypothetical protein [Bradyrhizobium ottawaense]|uniref:Lipoprotein n=1 Tax=Bradyrhizobium ottawaense TaxID=931866 RepID=A0ABY0QHC7_9BRAD|nr:hypothetical protein [Bradyrhizobium ottawaense]SDK44252.1 hypothetical protein SAMN05444163_8122 [Bradyrhizobium ottawaense]